MALVVCALTSACSLLVDSHCERGAPEATGPEHDGGATQSSGGGTPGSGSQDSGGTTADGEGGADGVGEPGQNDGSQAAGGAGGSGAPTGTGGGGAGDNRSSQGSDEPPATWYVDDDSAGGDGTSWGGAFGTLQGALTNSQLKPGDQIWVAEGTYAPEERRGSRALYFNLMTGVAVYGGFDGTETALADRGPVDPSLTILTGDLNGNDSVDESGNPTDRDDNSYHVVVGANDALLDGFTITGGNANGSTGEQKTGGGIYNYVCDGLQLVNLVLGGNMASGAGGGMYNAPSSYATLALRNLAFVENRSGSSGGGMYNGGGNAKLTNVTFSKNISSGGGGGGMYNAGGNPTLMDVTFSANTSGGSFGGAGGGMYNADGSPTLINASFSANTTGGGYGGGLYNTGGNPTLVNVTFNANTASGFFRGYGGGVHNDSGDVTLTNATFFQNASSAGGDSLYASDGSHTLTNVIMQSDYAGSPASHVGGTGLTFSYSNIQGCGGSAAWDASCGTDAGANLDTTGGLFATYRAPSGSWTEAPAYSSETFQTTFTNASAPWSAGELVGMFIQPDINDPRPLPIVANTADAMTVWGDVAGWVAEDAMYFIHNLSLAAGSDCIDSGNSAALPTDARDLDADGDVTEPLPLDLVGRPRLVNGSVDMGAYEHQRG